MHERVEVLAGLDAGAIGEGGLDEADVEADVVADEDVVAREVEQLRGGLGRAGRAFHVGVGDAVDLLADDAAGGLDERLEAVGDLAAGEADGADLDELAGPGVLARGLGVEDDEGLAGIDRVHEVDDGVDGRLDVGDLLGLADQLAQLLLQLDDRLAGSRGRT